MKIVVTGGTGFIGSHLVEALKERGDKVSVVARTKPSPEYSGRYSVPGCTLLTWDIGSDYAPSGAGAVLRDADAVIHCAAHAGLVRSWPAFQDYAHSNIVGTRNVLELCKGKRLVYVSSSSVYGVKAMDAEDAPKRPVSPYGVSKLAGELLCQAYATEYGVKLSIVRPFTVYGPRQRSEMVHHIFLRALLLGEPIIVHSDGRQARSHTYVTDLVDGIVRALDNGKDGAAYNLGSGVVADMLTLLAECEDAVGVKAASVEFGPRRAGDQRMTWAQYNAAKTDLGWEPRTDLGAGLREQAEWMRGLYGTATTAR